nr:RidA family protein [Hyphomonas sp. Mor2]
MRLAILPALCLAMTACQTLPAATADENDIRFITDGATGYPFSPAVEADGWVFLSGALGITPEGKLIEGGIEPETRQTMDNIQATLESAGLGMDRVVKCTVFLADIAEWPAFNEVYKTYFDGNYPARSALGASGLALGARVEIECIARR